MSFSANLDTKLTGTNGQWLWTPRGVSGPGDNSKGLWAVNCNLNQDVTGADVILKSIWVNSFNAPIKITRIVSNIGTEFRQQILASQGGPAYVAGEGAPIAQYEGSVLLQEMTNGAPCDHLPLLSHGPSVFNHYQTLDWDKDVTFDDGQEPIVLPNDALEFLINNFWPYANASWNVQFNFVVYFRF